MADPTPTIPIEPFRPPASNGLASRLLRGLVFTVAFVVTCFLAPAPRLLAVHPLVALSAFAATCYGLSYILTISEASEPFRQLLGRIPCVGAWFYEADDQGEPQHGLLACPLCTGTWVGATLAAAGLALFDLPHHWLALVLHGLMGTAVGDLVRRSFRPPKG